MSSTTVTPVDLKVAKRRGLRLVSRLLGGAVVLLIVAAAAAYFYATSPLPQVDGAITVAGVSAPVEVIRDPQGVPHIRAQSLSDLLFAQGYVTAQDRLWQMDMTRRYAAGELAEILGADQVKHDREQRILSLRQAAQQPASKNPDDEDDMGDPATDTNIAAAPFLGTRSDEDALLPGSNDWVVSGAHTVTGKPMLSSDMHLHHQIPNVWYETHLTAQGFDAAGVTLPGLPFVIVGHNQRIAWAFTNLGPDVEDIFIENFNGSGEYQTPA